MRYCFFLSVYQEACVKCSVGRNIGWCGAICGVMDFPIYDGQQIGNN